MTPCEKLGYKVGDEFRYTGSALFKKDSLCVLINDDGSNFPEFKGEMPNSGRLDKKWVELEDVEPIYSVPITLRPGDYVSTKGMTEGDYHAVAAAFMTAGCGDEHDHLKGGAVPTQRYLEWYLGDLCATNVPEPESRHLTIKQVLSTTNADNKTENPQQEPATMHLTDLLYQARKERDEAQARYEQILADHRATYPWLVVEENAQPAEDMSDPANWKMGDLITSLEGRISITEGKQYIFTGIDEDGDYKIMKDDGGDDCYINKNNAKWHSRP